MEPHSIRRVLQRDQEMEYPVTFHVVQDDKAIGYQLHQSEHDLIEACVMPNGPRLIDLYWRIMHPPFPMFYKQGFMENYSRSYQLVSAPLLGAMYLVALGWWDYDCELSNSSMPDVTNESKHYWVFRARTIARSLTVSKRCCYCSSASLRTH